MRTSSLLAGLTIPFGNATDQKAGIVKFGTREEILRARSERVAVTPEPELMANSFRNLAINGSFLVWTKGESFIGKSGLSNLSFPDCWKVQSYGDWVYDIVKDVGGSYGSSFMGNNMMVKFTTADPSVNSYQYHMIHHGIEKNNLIALLNNPFSVSFNTFSNKAGTAYFALRNKDVTKSYVAPIAVEANTWKRHKIEQIPSLVPNAYSTFYPDSLIGLHCGITLACGEDYKAGVTNQWVNGNKISGTGQSNFGSSPNDIFKIADFQIEPNAFVTPFEARPFGFEKQLTSRYVEGLQISNKQFAATSALTGWDNIDYKVFKRGEPSVSVVLIEWSPADWVWVAPASYTFYSGYTGIDSIVLGMSCNATDTYKFSTTHDNVYHLLAVLECSL